MPTPLALGTPVPTDSDRSLWALWNECVAVEVIRARVEAGMTYAEALAPGPALYSCGQD